MLRARVKPSRRRGFTLIEILVVVAIIALLITILLPSLKRARDQAKVTVCKVTLHDLGTALHEYATDHNAYFALPSYMGCTTWFDNPGADDNLFVLWYKRYCRDIGSFVCAGTKHRVRTPQRVDRVAIPGKGFEYQVYTAGQRRNDFELHAECVTQIVQLPSSKIETINGFGTSYEYMGWLGTTNVTRIDWWPLNKKFKQLNGEPMSLRHIKDPSRHAVMKDADEGEGSTAPNGVVGAPPGKATNNLPEPWDNHGDKFCNVLYTDSHVESLGLGYWQTLIRTQSTP